MKTVRARDTTPTSHNSPRTKWYAVKRETWLRFIEHLKTIQKPVEELTEEERNLWDCYYIAKEHGKNAQGLLELPWNRWLRVNELAE